jgi:hypothetical protein
MKENLKQNGRKDYLEEGTGQIAYSEEEEDIRAQEIGI